MSRTRKLVSIIGATATAVGVAVAGAGGPAGASSVPKGSVPLRGSVASFTTHSTATGQVARSDRLTIQMWLRPQVAAAERFASAVSTPGSPLYHHYLSPNAYTARFGATAAEAARTEAWLRSQGFGAVHSDSQRDYVRATASVAAIEAAFHVTLNTYRASAQANAGPYQLRANNRPVSVPSSLAGSVLGVTGLDNAAPILPLERPSTLPPGSKRAEAAGGTAPCSFYYGQHMATGLPKQFGKTSFPTENCGYRARQLEAAYGASPRAAGTGQTIALVELGLTTDMFTTLRDYAAVNHIAAPSTHRYSELSLGKNTCGDPFFIEEQLDVEASYDMAPGANQLVVGGDGCNSGDFGLQGLFNADQAIINGTGGHPLATVASNSWEGGDDSQPPFVTNIETAYLMKAAAVGVGMYFSSGDGSGVEEPSTSPFAVSVGGTTLGIGKTNNRLFETGWSTGFSILSGSKWLFLGEQGAAGGGPSILWKQPAYQKGVVPAALARAPGNRGGPVRSSPDISADADPYTGFAVGLLVTSRKHPKPTFRLETFGGTSEAAPLVAGLVTDAQQGQRASFGLINPALYKLAGTSAFFDTLPLTASSPALWRGTACDKQTCGAQLLTTFDDQSFGMLGYSGQVTLKGYDNMSGLGAPDGPNFIKDLRALH